MKNKKNILLVDDEFDFCKTVCECLEEKNCRVIRVSSKESAYETALSENLSLVVLGNILPRGAAFKLHCWLKTNPHTQEVPQVVLDAPPEEHLRRGWRRDEGMRIDAAEYFCKPIKPEVLAHEAWKLLGVEEEEIKVLIADDHAMVREGIRTLLNLQKDIYIVGEATNGVEAVDKALDLVPDVVLMDIVMPQVNGIEATKKIFKQCQEKIKVLMLSQYDDAQNLSSSKEAGAFGFVSKKGVSDQLLSAVRAASRGEMPGWGTRQVC